MGGFEVNEVNISGERYGWIKILFYYLYKMLKENVVKFLLSESYYYGTFEMFFKVILVFYVEILISFVGNKEIFKFFIF